MEKTKRKPLLSLRAKRIASIKSKIRNKQKQTARAKTQSRTKAFASLEHMLNATALYQMGEYERASLAFQRAMAEPDATEMLESLESAQAELEGGDLVSDELESKSECAEDDAGADYLDEEEEVSGEDQDLVLEDENDEEMSSDVLDSENEDFSVDDTDVEEFSVASRAKKNALALKLK